MPDVVTLPVFPSAKERDAFLKYVMENRTDAQREGIVKAFFHNVFEHAIDNRINCEGGQFHPANILMFFDAYYTGQGVYSDVVQRKIPLDSIGIIQESDTFTPVGIYRSLDYQPLHRLYIDRQNRLHLSHWEHGDHFVGKVTDKTIQQFNQTHAYKLVAVLDF